MSKKPRLGRAQRLANRDKWEQFRSYRGELITRNVTDIKAGNVPEPVKFAVGRPLGENGARAKVSQLIIRKDGKRQQQLKGQWFKTQDSDHYRESIKVEQQSREVLVRVGTTAEHMLPLSEQGRPVLDERGKQVFIRIKAKPKFRPVGEQGSVPKDGGK